MPGTTREGHDERLPGLQPGLIAVVVGPFESRAEADAVLARVRQAVPDAYVKRGR